MPSTGDYDGDGWVDAAVWTPSTGRWRVFNLQDLTVVEQYLGASGDIPVASAFNR